MVSANNSGITPKSSKLQLGAGRSISGKKQIEDTESATSDALETPEAKKGNLGAGRPPAGPGKQGPADANLSLTWGAAVPILTKPQMRPIAK